MMSKGLKRGDCVLFSMPHTGGTPSIPAGSRGVVEDVQHRACLVHFENEVTRTVLTEFLTLIDPGDRRAREKRLLDEAQRRALSRAGNRKVLLALAKR